MSLDTAMERLRAANPAPDTRLLRDESEDLAVLLATTWQRSTNMQTQQPQKARPPEVQNRRGWLVAIAAFAAVLILGVIAVLSSTSTDSPAVTTPTTQAPPTTEPTPTTEAAATPAVPRTIEIEAFDYGYTGFDTDFKVGDILELFNSSESEYHSLIVIRINDDSSVKTIEDVVALDPIDIWYSGPEADNFGRRLHAAPGTKAKGRARLSTPGTYIALDWIPQNADPDAIALTLNPTTDIANSPPFGVAGGPLGYQHGMIIEFTVTE